MAGPDDMPQRFSEEEVQTLLRKAIERQEADRQRHAHLDHGLTLAEIKQIAAEAGVEPRYVTAAAADLRNSASRPEKTSIWGGPLKFEITRIIPGVLTVEKIGALTGAIREDRPRDRGHLEVLGHSFDWTSGRQSGENYHIRAETQQDQTRLHLSFNLSNIAPVFYLPSMFAVMLAFPLLAVEQELIAGGLVALLALLLTFGMRMALNAYARSKVSKLEALAEKLTKIAEERTPAEARPAPAQPLPEAPRTPEATPPLLDLDDAEDVPSDAPTRRRRSIYGSLD